MLYLKNYFILLYVYILLKNIYLLLHIKNILSIFNASVIFVILLHIANKTLIDTENKTELLFYDNALYCISDINDR